MIESSINQDLKQALLSGNKEIVSTLRFVKSSIQDFKVNNNLDRQLPLDDQQTIVILNKELKKLNESLDIFKKTGSTEKIVQSESEIEIIKKYLPKAPSEAEIEAIVEDIVASNPDKNMGQLIALTREKAGPMADGSLLAKMVKEKIS